MQNHSLTLNQGEIDLLKSAINTTLRQIERIQNSLTVGDIQGEEMLQLDDVYDKTRAAYVALSQNIQNQIQLQHEPAN